MARAMPNSLRADLIVYVSGGQLLVAPFHSPNFRLIKRSNRSTVTLFLGKGKAVVDENRMTRVNYPKTTKNGEKNPVGVPTTKLSPVKSPTDSQLYSAVSAEVRYQ